ncbi:aromatic acid exporter family member 1 [Kitasatospora sp. SolWspMP-SS2h]|uniref:FUSC family protein n=1 Tax=Kitasatospora sp. SolWspMP-SS2h TaxID=1305729 RepID=UPI000DBF3F65|nr:aromatic acid exporter family protein [Kitasatospora sp. SolWspMP-SS2h]RAJ45350.1 aromatic acid exporter family member 1 [Kitasatospora sp. SolWspMP-SS2h]
MTAPGPVAAWRGKAADGRQVVRDALRHPGRAVRAHREGVVRTARVAVACALAWEVAVVLLGEDEQPVLAPLAALLTVQLTVFRTLAQGLRQFGGVMLGAVAALGLLRLAGANFATIGLAVGVCLGLGKLLRLGEQATEVPVTVLLVLSTGAPYAPVRIWDTLVGVASGVLVNLVAAPPTYVGHAADRSARVAHRLADIAHDTARGLREGWDERTSDGWLRRVETAARELDRAREAAVQAEEGIRLNPRRLRQGTDPAVALGPLGEGLTCLGHVCDQLGSVLRGLDDLARGERQFPREAEALSDARERVRPIGDVLEAVGDALDVLARIQRDHVREAGHTDDLTAALERGRDHHAAAAETLCRTDHGPAVWSLHGSIMDETQQILHELDPRHGPHPAALHPQPLRLAAPRRERPEHSEESRSPVS